MININENKKPLCPRCWGENFEIRTYEKDKYYGYISHCKECEIYHRFKVYKGPKKSWLNRTLEKYMDWLHGKKVGE